MFPCIIDTDVKLGRSSFANAAQTLTEAGVPTIWYGPASDDAIAKVEARLDVTFPADYAAFLRELGGGGVEFAEISGIDDDVLGEDGNTVLGDTKRLRSEFHLPAELAVLRIDEDEFAWCVECGPEGGRVVGVELRVDGSDARSLTAADFRGYFAQYVSEQRTLHEAP